MTDDAPRVNASSFTTDLQEVGMDEAPTKSNGSKQRVLADPHAELPIKNYKYVKNCTELFLAQRGIDALAHFEGFVNLEVLWLNGNRIETLDGLDQCFRIKQLYAQSNRIRSLSGSSLAYFAFLDTLRLNDNKLRDLQATLSVLGKLHHLQDLDLYGNPLEEEDNYRLHVIRAVPSLVVLDRHVVTDHERGRAARLQDEPAGGRSSAHKKPRKKKTEMVAGAPPQTMSGTVKMLFKEIEKMAREAEAERKAVLEKELRLVDQQQQQLTKQTAATSRPRSSLNAKDIGGLDAWELAALEKKFHSFEDKSKPSGILREHFKLLVAYLSDRGFVVLCGGKELPIEHDENKTVEQLKTVFSSGDGNTKVTWPQLRLALAENRLQCELLAPMALTRKADAYFAEAATIQHKALAAKGATGDKGATLQQEMHELSQRAYHLAALADREASRSSSSRSRSEDAMKRSEELAPLKTKYYLTAYSRDATATKAFNELKEQSAHVDTDLATKYKFQQKDFQKYLVRQAPPTTTLARRQYQL